MRIRPWYSRTSVNVGEATAPSNPRARAAPRTNVVLPAPSSPVRAMTSPSRRSEATASPTAIVSSGAPAVSSSRIRTDRAVPRPAQHLGQRALDLLEVRAKGSHLRRGLAAAAKDGRRMECRDDRAPLEGEPLAPDPADRYRLVQHEPGGEVPERHDHAGIHQLDLLPEPR